MDYILSASEIKAWDAFTIENEPISSIDLMERAAAACSKWLMNKYAAPSSFAIFCGNGNNGGDGLAIARILAQHQYTVKVFIDDSLQKSIDNKKNLHELTYLYPTCIFSLNEDWLIDENDIIIDSIFGIGIQRALEGKEKNWVTQINAFTNKKISIDMPSGLSADFDLRSDSIVQADYTLSFQCYKKTFMFVETGMYAGEIIVLDIGLHQAYLTNIRAQRIIINKHLLHSFLINRKAFAHKGIFGHALLIAGSHGKMGASILASKAALRSGAGLVSVLVPETENAIVQSSVPEAMSINYKHSFNITSLEAYQAIGIGCGLGQGEISKTIFTQLLSIQQHPIIIDADAINLVANHPELLALIPKGSILTPHVKEFDRLFGPSANAAQRFELQKQKSKELQIIILLKGRYTCITTPGGISYFNITGNAGMATGGTGDVLTGIITGLYAQYKDILKAALLGVYLHGLAADIAITKNQSKESLIASDIIEFLGSAFQEVHQATS
ncbi:MAG: NAD(P)H-hydrate dehydratase [Bacteroidota bacterium]